MFANQMTIHSNGTRSLEQFHAFAARQSCPYIEAGRQASMRTGEDVVRIVFANGAVSDGQTHLDPSPNPREVLGVRHEYVTAALAKEENDFIAYREGILHNVNIARQTHGLPSIDHEAPALLKAGKERIEELRAELAAIEDQLEGKDAQRNDEQQRLIRDAMAQRSAEAVAVEMAVRDITI